MTTQAEIADSRAKARGFEDGWEKEFLPDIIKGWVMTPIDEYHQRVRQYVTHDNIMVSCIPEIQDDMKVWLHALMRCKTGRPLQNQELAQVVKFLSQAVLGQSEHALLFIPKVEIKTERRDYHIYIPLERGAMPDFSYGQKSF